MTSDKRSFGTVITGNRQKGQELSSELCAVILAAIDAGESKAAVARRFNVSRAVVYKTIERFNTTQNFEALPRSGRPKSLTPRQTRALTRAVRTDFRMPRKSLVTAQGLEVSPSTLGISCFPAIFCKRLGEKRRRIGPDDLFR
ncbi:hypothetical protein V2G26_010907 [Clonostachys chloroleuca]